MPLKQAKVRQEPSWPMRNGGIRRAMHRPGPAASSLSAMIQMRPPVPAIAGHAVMPTLRRRIKDDVLGDVFEPLANLWAH